MHSTVIIERLPNKRWNVAVFEAFDNFMLEIGSFQSLAAAQQEIRNRYNVPMSAYARVVPGRYMAECHVLAGEQSQTAHTFS